MNLQDAAHAPETAIRSRPGSDPLIPLLTITMLAAISLAATASSTASPSPLPLAGAVTPATGAEARANLRHGPRLSPAELRRLAQEAYIWAWPLAFVHHCRTRLERVPAPGLSGGMPVAPLNRLCMLTDRIDARATAIPCPNQDVIYGFGLFDLAETPVVLQVPDFGDRFWLYQLGDQRTDGFADIGSMYGTKPGCYLVVGPDWSGPTPAGIAGILRSPTRYAYCLPRVFFSAESGDREAVQPAVHRVMAYPLDEFTGAIQTTDWSRLRWLPNLAGRGRRGHGLPPEHFLDVLEQLLDDVPPLPGEEDRYHRYRGLLSALRESPAAADAALAAVLDADREIVQPLFEFRNVGLGLPGHWRTIANGAAFGSDYLTRTAVAKSNVFVNRNHETKYYYQDFDADGMRLDGHRSYRLHFPAGRRPPAKGFWSLTVYDERHALPDGVAASIGSRHPGLRTNADGSITIIVGPGAAAEPQDRAARSSENRLVTPRGAFSLFLRIYWPDEAAIDGSWTPPVVEPLDSGAPLALHKSVGER